MSVSTNRRTRRLATVAAAAGLVAAGAGLSAVLASPVQAIPVAQQACAFTVLTNTATSGFQPVTNSSVIVNNGTTARSVVVNFNADAGIDPGAEIRLGYSVDGGAVQTPGAQNFANFTEFWQTRHSMVVISIPAGVHQIQPYWRISGVAGKNGVLASRCLTAEAATS